MIARTFQLVAIAFVFAMPIGAANAQKKATCPTNAHPNPAKTTAAELVCTCNDGYEVRGGKCEFVLQLKEWSDKPPEVYISPAKKCVIDATVRRDARLKVCEPEIVGCLKKPDAQGVLGGCILSASAAGVAAAGVVVGAIVDPSKLTAWAAGLGVAAGVADCINKVGEIEKICGPSWGTCADSAQQGFKEDMKHCPRK
ncbi:MAG: hypothetical protein ACHQK9_06270 [Reyranellales bacterium]